MHYAYAYLAVAITTMFVAMRETATMSQRELDQHHEDRTERRPYCHKGRETRHNCERLHPRLCWRADPPEPREIYRRPVEDVLAAIGCGIGWPVYWLIFALKYQPLTKAERNTRRAIDLDQREKELQTALDGYEVLTGKPLDTDRTVARAEELLQRAKAMDPQELRAVPWTLTRDWL